MTEKRTVTRHNIQTHAFLRDDSGAWTAVIGWCSTASVKCARSWYSTASSRIRCLNCGMQILWQHANSIISLHLYSAFLGTQSALHRRGTSPQPPPVCSIEATAAIVCQNAHHTPSYWWRGDSDEANQCMGMIRRPWWSEANGQIWPGCRGYTPILRLGTTIIGFVCNLIHIILLMNFMLTQYNM